MDSVELVLAKALWEKTIRVMLCTTMSTIWCLRCYLFIHSLSRPCFATGASFRSALFQTLIFSWGCDQPKIHVTIIFFIYAKDLEVFCFEFGYLLSSRRSSSPIAKFLRQIVIKMFRKCDRFYELTISILQQQTFLQNVCIIFSMVSLPVSASWVPLTTAWLKSYLSHRSFSVTSGTSSSFILPLSCGVPKALS